MTFKLVVFSTCFFLCFPTAVIAADAADTKALTSQKDDASTQLFAMLDEYSQAGIDYRNAVATREEAQATLVEVEQRIEVLQVDLAKRANMMYRQGPFSTIDLLLGATSFKEFATTWDILRTINDQYVSRIEEMTTLKLRQSQLVDEAIACEQRAEALMAEIDSQTTALNNQIADIESAIRTREEQAKREQADAARAAAQRQTQVEQETIKIVQNVVADRPTPGNPQPGGLGDGAWDATILMLLEQHGVSADPWLVIIRNIIWRESTNNPNAVSPCGSWVGLCQFASHWDPPAGWSGTGDWRLDPVANIGRLVQFLAATGGLGNHWAATNY